MTALQADVAYAAVHPDIVDREALRDGAGQLPILRPLQQSGHQALRQGLALVEGQGAPLSGQVRMALWSLADSLYSIGAVEELRLLADGEELEFFGLIPVESVAVRPKG